MPSLKAHPYPKFFLESVARNLIVKIFAMIATKWTMKAMRIPQSLMWVLGGEERQPDNPGQPGPGQPPDNWVTWRMRALSEQHQQCCTRGEGLEEELLEGVPAHWRTASRPAPTRCARPAAAGGAAISNTMMVNILQIYHTVNRLRSSMSSCHHVIIPLTIDFNIATN